MNLDEVVDRIIQYSNPSNILGRKTSFEDGTLKIGETLYNLSKYRNIVVFAYGKASHTMYRSLSRILHGYVDEGYVIVDKRVKKDIDLDCEVLWGSHPLPDEETISSSKIFLERASTLEKGDLSINLISGGGSSLFEIPHPPLELEDILDIWDYLIKKGCNINELNTVRRHLSRIKGGRFAKDIYPANTLSLIISDVVGDYLHDIASGPTTPDPTYYEDALKILKRYQVEERNNGFRFVSEGVEGKHPETLKPRHPVFKKVDNIVVGGLSDLANDLAEYFISGGHDARVVEVNLQGDVRYVSSYIASYLKAMSGRRGVYIFGGEAYTEVTWEGVGGPNHELTLHLYMALRRMRIDADILCIDTDGFDGNTNSAGAFINTYRQYIEYNVILKHLERNDSHTLLKRVGETIEMGPTGSNLNSIWIIKVNR